MRKLAQRFVPAADEVYRLENDPGAECEFFRKLAKKKATNPDDPTGSKQGMYACTPSGKLLESVNTLEADEMVALLEKALAAWEKLPKEKRLAKKLPARPARPEDRYPETGLVLHVFGRDLPAEGRETDAWNQDHVWFKKDEASGFLPEKLEKGQTKEAPLLAKRLAATALLDWVRGETDRFQENEVVEAALTLTVRSVEKGRVHIEISGKTRTKAEGKWPIAGFEDADKPTPQKRGVALELVGEAVFEKDRFVAFELAAIGKRYGGTQYNMRAKDLDEAPIGFWIELADSKDRVAPTWLSDYGW